MSKNFVNGQPWSNGQQQITGPKVNGAFQTLYPIFNSMGTWDPVSGQFTINPLAATNFYGGQTVQKKCLAPGQTVTLPTGALPNVLVSVSDCTPGGVVNPQLLSSPETVLASSDATISGSPSFQLTVTGETVSFRRTQSNTWVPEAAINTPVTPAQLPADIGDVARPAGSNTTTIQPNAVTAGKMATGAAVGNLGYTPLNKAGDTGTGAFNFANALSWVGALLQPYVANNSGVAGLNTTFLSTVEVAGYATAGDGGRHKMVYDPANACGAGGHVAADGVACINSTFGGSPAGSWNVDVASLGGQITPYFYGAKGAGVDETTQLRATAALANALGVTANLAPAGSTFLASTIGLKSNSRVRIDGTLKSNGQKQNLLANYSFVYQTGGPYETNVTIEGSGTIDNAQPQTYTASSAGTAPVSCIAGLGPVSDWTIRDVTVQNCSAWPINFNGSSAGSPGGSATSLATHIDIEHVIMQHSGNSFEFSNCDDCHARNVYLSDIADFCAAFYGNVHNSSMEHVRGDQCSSGGIAVLADGNATASPRGANTYVSTDLVIDEPILSRTGGPAIFIDNQATGITPVQQHQNIRIVSPEGYGNNYANQTNFGGLFCSHANNVKTINAQWSHDGPTSGTNTAISGETYSETCSNPTSIGTTVTDEGGNGGTGNAISNGITFLNGGPVNPTIIGLSVIDDQATKTMAYAINGAIGAGGMVTGITVSGLAGSTFGPNFARATGTTVLGNQGADSYLPQNLFLPNLQAAGSITSSGVGIFKNGLTLSPPAFQPNLSSASSVALAANTTVNVPSGRGKLMVTDTAHGLLCEWYYGNGGTILSGGTTTSYCATSSQTNGANKLAMFFNSSTSQYQFQTTWTDTSDTFYVKNDVVAGIQ